MVGEVCATLDAWPPVLSADHALWLHIDDIDVPNDAVEPFGLTPAVDAETARRRGRYVLENVEHVDVLVGRALVAWFTQRYPTGAERLAYARRAYARWMREPASAVRREE